MNVNEVDAKGSRILKACTILCITLICPSCQHRDSERGVFRAVPESVDLGVVERGTTVRIEVVLENNTPEELELGDPRFSCACVMTKELPGSLPRQSSHTVLVDLQVLWFGPFRTSIAFKSISEGRAKFEEVKIHGIARHGDVEWDPLKLYMSPKTGEQRINIYRRDGAPVEVTSVSADPWLCVEIEPRGATSVIVVCVAKEPKSSTRSFVKAVVAEDDGTRKIEIPVEWIGEVHGQ